MSGREVASLLFFIFCGFLVGRAIFEITSDVMIALLGACTATSYIQRAMRKTGIYKRYLRKRGSNVQKDKDNIR